ncbi:type III pantothenate kinase [Pedobacter sp. SYSU D00535]|uniref:type III pantothenate kinase n=1 Tax=Pedobacter sp. SYSU D00535 TaxID=2810308 RepID=UPI001A97B0C4|nr:type III pantothenate kinase [Pedobacter sp. SYSU D00535]
MLNLVIDIGNTLSKVALFNGRSIVEQYVLDRVDEEAIAGIIEGKRLDHAIISSVSYDITAVENYLRSVASYIRFSAFAAKKLNNQYKTPETLGLDRYAAVIGATYLFNAQDVLVVDAGTCITYDFVDKDRNYFGGSISPGIAMRYKAMNAFTGKLPLLNMKEDFNASNGVDTATSILSGVQNGVVYELKGFIASYLNKYPELVVALCGGNVKFFETQLKNSIFAPIVRAVPDLVLIGLNEVIYQNNE